jgi:hypothetical protein
MNPPAHESKPVVPEHELLRVIGQGSYGEVWLARTELGRHRAVKIVRRAHFLDDAPFRQEYEGLRHYEPISRSHPSQLPILQVGRRESEGCFYSVMELADDLSRGHSPGGFDEAIYRPKTLRSFLRARGRLTPAEVLELALALADSLGHLHSHDLRHRDLKPSNIIYSGGRPKLADVGLVTTAAEDLSVVGTAGFSPPEGSGSVAGDIYSLGKVLYEALTGRDREEFPRVPRDLAVAAGEQALFQGLNGILLRCADPEPARRYPDAGQLLGDLRALQAGQPIPSPFRWTRLTLALGLAGFVVGIVGVGWREIASPKTTPWTALGKRLPILAGPLTNVANGHQYFLLEASGQETARTTADRMGGYLAVIRNAQENEWVYRTFGSFGGQPRNLWIGLEDADASQNDLDPRRRALEFRWQNGEPVTYTDWSLSEPNNYNGIQEIFAHIWAPGFAGRSGHWNSAESVSQIENLGIHGVVELETGASVRGLIPPDGTTR